jgi:hypothetical protein
MSIVNASTFICICQWIHQSVTVALHNHFYKRSWFFSYLMAHYYLVFIDKIAAGLKHKI